MLLVLNLQRGITFTGGAGDEYPLLELRHFGGACLIALGLAIWVKLNWIGFRWTLGPFVWVAPISYGLYAVHYPLLRLVPIIPLPAWAATAAMVALAIALAWWLELRMQPWIRRRLRRKRESPTPVPAAAGRDALR